MKKHFLLFMVIALPYFGFAQGNGKFLDKLEAFAGKGDTLGVMLNDTYIIDGPGNIINLDGSVQNGTIKYVMTTNSKDMTFVQFIPEGEMKPKIIKSNKLNGFMVKGRTFVPVRAKLDDLSIGNLSPFMEMLNEHMQDKYQMYMFRKITPNTSGIGNTKFDLSRYFFVYLPAFKNAHSIEDIKFTPFAKRMSGYIADFPELAKKVADKAEGYKVSLLNGAANAEVYYRIMEEYNEHFKTDAAE